MIAEAARALVTPTDDVRKAEQLLRPLIEAAGIEINGSAPHDLQVRDRRMYQRVLRQGSLGFGEAYIDGWWDAESLDQCLVRLIQANLKEKVRGNMVLLAHAFKSRVLNLQAVGRAFEVGEKHYDIGNDLYEAMLDERLVYTCGYWRDAADLDAAQEAKLDLVCRKIGLEPGMRVLELGCGWGSFAQFAAERYGAHVVGYTVSRAQVELGRARCVGLPVELHLADYREATGAYDAVVSIGIMEHVGHKNYRTYMEVADRCLAPGGTAFVHTIAGNVSRTLIDPWIHKYIFPNALLPSLAQLGRAMEGLFFVEDLHNIGPDYDRTLMAWYQNFERAWPTLRARYDDRFYRVWKYYLLQCAAGFRCRYTQLFQLVLNRPGTTQPDCRKS